MPKTDNEVGESDLRDERQAQIGEDEEGARGKSSERFHLPSRTRVLKVALASFVRPSRFLLS
jgi:hypothetical protein